MTRPSGACTPPETSETAMTVAPRPCSSVAATPPTLPKPSTMQRWSERSRSIRSQARSVHMTTPAPVASRRKTGAPDRDGLPGHHFGDGVPDLRRVGVHHPSHRLFVRRHVGCGNVLLRADGREQLGREASREPLELVLRERVRVATDTALRAAVREAEQRALPRHPGRKRGALTERGPRGRSRCRPSSGRGRSNAGRGSRRRPATCRRPGGAGRS